MLVLRGSCLTQSFSQLSYIYIYETFWHLFMDGVQLPQGYTATIRRFLPQVSKNSWYLLDQSWKDESMRWPWIHPVVLNSGINLIIIKYKLKPQDVKLTQLWLLTVNYVKVTSQSYWAELSWNCQKFVSSAHMQAKWL